MAEMAGTDSANKNKALFMNCLETNELFTQIMKEFTGDPDCCKKPYYLWLVDNKYYSSEISLQYGHIANGEVHANMEEYDAVVLTYDCTDKSNAQFVSSLINIWHKVTAHLSCDKDFEAPVCLLVAVVDQQNSSDHLEQVLKWCIGNGFELIEWTSAENYTGEDSMENTGTVRLAEALQAHVWPQITMKSGGSVAPSHKAATCPHSLTKELLSEDERLLAEGCDEEQDPGGGSFEELFAKFADMKAHAQQLPQDQRKEYAEKVVLAFWDAIGGDEEEVKDLDNL